VDEDGRTTSFAGQYETFLNVSGLDGLFQAVEGCRASSRSPRAVEYRRRNGLPTDRVDLAVLVQRLVPADVSAVMFTANPVSARRDQIVINASWGLGESIVGGTVTPDMVVVRKDDLVVVSRQVAFVIDVPDPTVTVA
jgi:pyruvate,water dikinase